MAVFSTIVFLIFGSIGAYVGWKIIAVGLEAMSPTPKNVSTYKYEDGDEYGDQFYVTMPDGSVRID